MVNIKGLSKAAVLAALYNTSKPLGMGFLQYNPKPMTEEEAAELLNKSNCFDYLYGRLMKIDLKSDDEFNEWGYDRDLGSGSAQRAIDLLRASRNVNNDEIRRKHVQGVSESALETSISIKQPTITTTENGVATIHLGLGDAADHLKPKIKQAMESIKNG